jgi:YHS domain-containing protein
MRSVLSAIAVLLLAGSQAHADDAQYNTVDRVGLHGFDPVAFFTQHRAVKGTPDNVADYEGVTYEFVSQSDAETFRKEPAKYAPLYHGFCTTAVAEGVKADIDPHAFAIHGGKLSVFYSDEAKATFDKDPAGVLKQAATNWPAVQTQQHVIR